MLKKLLFLLLLSYLFIGKSYGQLSKLHYLPPIYTERTNDTTTIDYVNLFLSTPYDTIFYVKLYHGVNDKVKDSIKLSSKHFVNHWLGRKKNALGVVEGLDNLNKALDSKGIRLEADMPFFVNIRTKSRSQGSSLTSKGIAGLGTEFRTGHMFNAYDPKGDLNDDCSNFISVMATANNTKVTFSGIKQGVYFHGTEVEGEKLKQYTTKPHTVTLKKGQSYVIAELAREFSVKDENKSFGTLVTSSKPIAVSVGSAIGRNPSREIGWDVGIDQIVPVSNLSNEYVLIKGEGNPDLERPVVVATEDETVVKLRNEVVAKLDAGEYYALSGEAFSKGTKNMYISSNHPIYVYQTLAGSDFALTCGLNLIPPLNECRSGNTIIIPHVKFVDPKSNTNLNIIAKPLSDVKIFALPQRKFLARTGIDRKANVAAGVRLNWYSWKYHVPNGVNHLLVESDEAVNISMSIQSGAVGAAAYFSGFTPSPTIYPIGGIASFYHNGRVDFTVKERHSFSEFHWYKDDVLIAKTKTLVLESVTEYGDYYVMGIDRGCRNKKFKSNIIRIQDIKEVVEEDVQDLFTDEVTSDLEKVIIEDSLPASVLLNLNYIYDKAELVEESYLILEEAIKTLKKHPVKLKIVAHTDCKGSDSYNLSLSKRRAEFVMNYMISKGIPAESLSAEGKGESAPLPIAKCDCEKNECSEAQLALNRRSEFIIER